MSERLSPERAVRLLRAKAAELEADVRHERNGVHSDVLNLMADLALIAGLLADHIEQSPGPWGPEDEDWGRP